MPEQQHPLNGDPGRDPGHPLTARDFAHDDLDGLRHEVTRLAERNGLTDPALYRFVLAVHELATNAVRHGGGHGHLELRRTDDHLRCRITDHGPGIPQVHPPGRPAPGALSGRGLWLAGHGGQLTWTSDSQGATVILTCPVAAPIEVEDLKGGPGPD
ncbi:ATP-binding protein [Actinoplanes sp. NPDC049548]|uniref:ATP-binding protein n=1 Tax=Actinoplanes sp. NPDC049548 TaxID=3155152 RepID=UPI00343041AA